MADEETNQETTGGTDTQTPAQNPTASPNGGTESQDQSPAWLPRRIEEERKATLNRLLKKLGVQSQEELEAALTEGRKLKEAQMTEAEKAANDLKVETRRREAAEARVTELEAAQVRTVIDSALKDAAKGVKYPLDVITHARTHLAEDVAKLVVKDGNVDPKEVEKLVAKVKAARPDWFIGGGPGSPSNRGGRVPEPGAKEKEEGKKTFRQQVRRMT